MIKVLKQALEALEIAAEGGGVNFHAYAEELRQAIAELESQEPVAWMYQEYRDDDQFGWRDEIQFVQPPNDPNYFRHIVPVYTHPPQRTWVGLTSDEILDLFDINNVYGSKWIEFARCVEAKLKEKNCAG